MRYLWLAVLLCVVVGCGSAEEPTKQATAEHKPAKKKAAPPAEKKTEPPPPPPKIPDDAFADIPAALDALIQAAEKSDQAAMSRADQWMVQRGAAGIAPLGDVLKDDSAPLAKRISASRALAQMGPAAKAALFEGLKSSQQRIRIVSIEALGRIKPSDKEIIATCIKLVKDDADPDVQRYAVGALGKIGPSAKDAVPLLMEMRNSKKYNETVRAEALRSLKLVDERRGLMGLNEEK